MASPQAVISGNRDERRTLVVIFLRGAADGLALVPPVTDDHYYRARPRLGILAKDAVKLDERFGLHPKLRPLESAWREGGLAIVHACGAVGKALPECLLGAPTVTVMQSLEDFAIAGRTPALGTQLEKLYAMQRGQLGAAARDTFAALMRIEAMRTTKYRPENGATYGRDEFSNGLSQLARLLKADVGLEAASIDLAGWDSHFAQQGQVEVLAGKLADGLAAFRQDLGARMTTTTVVVMTEFGRTVEENSSFGTDHGRGSTMFVLGGGVRGGRIHGEWRGLAPDVLEKRGVLEGYGDLPVLNNYRNVLASVLARQVVGFGAVDMASVFPGFEVKPMGIFG